MSSTQKRSIKDHFTVISPPKKQEEPTIKLHPLFVKKPKATIVEEKKKENIAPPKPLPKLTPSTPPPPPPPTTKDDQAIPVDSPKAYTPKKRIIKSRPNPLDDIIKTDTHHFFLSQKNSRKKQVSCQLNGESDKSAAADLDIESVENLMTKYYTRAWKKQPCCEYLFNAMKNNKNNYKNKMVWCDKYRPNAVQGLLGYLPDYEYLRDWLERKKISSSKKEEEGEEESGSKKKKKEKKFMDAELEDPFSLMLFVGHHGTGKTAAVYTAAKETGYSVFEINSTSKRTGKDVLNQVGEMTASHLVRFDQQQRKRKKQGETIILRDTVKKKKLKTIDIAMHFKKMVTVSEEQAVVVEEAVKEAEEEEEEEKPAAHTIESFFKRSAKTTTVIEKTSTTTSASSTIDENAIFDMPTIEEATTGKEEIIAMIQYQPKQSLALLEEVDILFEEDKGFWTAVIELCQKSKRPIIMTCNGSV